MRHLLAQESSGNIGSLLLYSLALIVLVVVAYIGVTWIRRQVKGEDGGASEGFTLSDLRRLHKSGQMTDDEYEKAKLLIIGSVKAPAAKKIDKPLPGIEQNKP